MKLNNAKKIVVAILMLVMAIMLFPSTSLAEVGGGCVSICAAGVGISCGTSSGCTPTSVGTYCSCRQCDITNPDCCTLPCIY